MVAAGRQRFPSRCQPAPPLGYYNWTFGQAARDPLYILVIVIFFPLAFVSVSVVALCAFALWWVTPDALEGGIGLYPILGVLILMNIAFAYAEVFHNAMLPEGRSGK